MQDKWLNSYMYQDEKRSECVTVSHCMYTAYPVGQPGVGSSTRDSEIWLKGARGAEWLSLWELCEGNLEGGLPCWGP